ncbi:MAG: hypothetical protein NVSMB14_12790 [Isosphaeraceae bacterium]
MATNKLTGKAGTVVFNGDNLEITKWDAKHNRDLKDSTDSTNYDAASNMVHKGQEPVALQTEVDCEGYFNAAAVDFAVINNLYSGSVSVLMALKFNAANIYGHGNFDVEKFETESPIMDVVKWKASFKSNNIFTVNA